MDQMTATEPESNGEGEEQAEQETNRRREERVEADFAVRIQAPARTEGQALELSPNGMRMEVTEDLTHAVHLSIYLELPDHPEPLPALADVRWHEKHGTREEPRWVVGVQFAELEDAPAAAIREFVEERVEPAPAPTTLSDETSVPAV